MINFDGEAFSNVSMILIAGAAAFLAALWLSLIFWVVRDIRSRTHDPLMILLSVLFVIILSIPGVLLYLIIRPGKTFEQKYQAALEEEALLQDMEKQLKCPSCGKNIKESWILCPSCHTKLKKQCLKCGEILALQWNLCPFCGEHQQKPYNNNGKASAD